MQDHEKSWEYAHEYVKKIEKNAEEKYGNDLKYPAMTGTLQSVLSSIFINLAVYHPDALIRVRENLDSII